MTRLTCWQTVKAEGDSASVTRVLQAREEKKLE
jgi:hypothetical protein